VSYGGLNKIVFNSEGISVTPLDLSDKRIIELNSSLILVFTGFTRFSKSLEFSKISSIEKKQNYYNQLKKIATQAEDILRDDSISISQIGYLLDESWQIKKSLGEGITNSELDDLYTKAISNGALGGKILGAGGGGFFLFFVPLEKQKSFKDKIGSNRIIDFSFEYSGSKILFNDENEMGD
jgi:D-glycero-alpha-D-manno-heptose-7-phosphate kinase